MALELQVQVVGLSLLTARRTGEYPAALYVMPKTDDMGAGSHPHGIHRHEAALYLGDIRDVPRLDPDAPDGDPTAADYTRAEKHQLNGKILRIVDSKWDKRIPNLRSKLLDIRAQVGGRVRSGAVAEQADRALVESGVEMQVGGTVKSEYSESYAWRRPDDTPVGRPTTQDRRSVWSHTLPDASTLSLEIRNVGTAPESGVPVPLPAALFAATGRALLRIFHLVPHEMPGRSRPQPAKEGGRVEHFEMLYTLLEGVTDPQYPVHIDVRRGSLQGCPVVYAE